MLSMDNLIEPTTTKTLINGVYKYFIEKKLYTFLDKNLPRVKHVMKNYIKVEKARVTK